MRPPLLQTGTSIGQESRKRWTVPIHAINPVRMNSNIFNANFIVFHDKKANCNVNACAV